MVKATEGPKANNYRKMVRRAVCVKSESDRIITNYCETGPEHEPATQGNRRK